MKKDYGCRPDQGGQLQAESNTLFYWIPAYGEDDRLGSSRAMTGGGEMTVSATGDIHWIPAFFNPDSAAHDSDYSGA